MDDALEPIARVVHAAIRTWSAAHGQTDILDWDEAPQWMKDSTRRSVRYVLNHPNSGAGAQHRQWMDQRLSEGWVFGPERDEALKTNPMLVPFDDLPLVEQKKDDLVSAIVNALI